MTKSTVSRLALFALACAASLPAKADLAYVGACADARAGACVLTDGSFEYLSWGGAKVDSAGLATLLGEGWSLGGRADFAAMVARNAPLATSTWNDAFFPDGPDVDGLDDIVFGTDAVLAAFAGDFAQLKLARSGDAGLAAGFRELVLKFGGTNANPAYTMTFGTADLSDASTRYTASLSAYFTDAGGTISRNNTFSGPLGDGTRALALEAISAQAYFLLRPVSVVPEPGAYALMLTGLGMVAGMAVRARRPARRNG